MRARDWFYRMVLCVNVVYWFALTITSYTPPAGVWEWLLNGAALMCVLQAVWKGTRT
jgi:hypothetical protein